MEKREGKMEDTEGLPGRKAMDLKSFDTINMTKSQVAILALEILCEAEDYLCSDKNYLHEIDFILRDDIYKAMRPGVRGS